MAEMEEPTIPFKNLSSREYPGRKKKVHSVAWNCTGTKLASGSVDQTARVWNIEPHGHGKVKDIELKGHTDSVDQLCWDPKHADLIATASGDKTVRLWDAWSGKCAQLAELSGENINITYKPDGTHIAVGNRDDELTILDVRKFKPIHKRKFNYEAHFHPLKCEETQIWRTVEKLLVDNQVEVREHAAAILAGLMKGGDEDLAKDFREKAYTEAAILQRKRKRRTSSSSQSIASIHGAVLALVASVLSAPYDIPSWLPEHVTLLARFGGEPSPVKSTVTKAVAEFRRTHADTWNIQKDSFSEEQLEACSVCVGQTKASTIHMFRY